MTKGRYKAHFGEGGPAEGLCPRGLQPRGEAKFFLRLCLMGRATLEQVKSDILMTREQLKWLTENNCAPSQVLESLYMKRQHTWQTFLQMHRDATRTARVAA